jgi:uncharacterized protein (DUF2147 family)
MQFKFLILTFILFISTFAHCQQKITGKWINEDNDAQIEIFQKEAKFFGKIVWLKEPNQPNGKPKTDLKNQNENLRKRPIIGLIILSDLTFSHGKWINGKIYSPKNGISADCSVSMVNDKELKLTVTKLVFKTTKIWKRTGK